MKKIKDYSLYLVTSEEYSKGRSSLEIASLAIQGGVDIIQMREKEKSSQELIRLGKELAAVCAKNGVTFIVNDYPSLAEEVGADGVHLGQEDIKKYSIKEVRKTLGKSKIVGVSTHSLSQFEEANKQDFDYIAFGPIFPTKTKEYWIGTEGIQKVLETSLKPVVFIGGINPGNMDEILKTGARSIAVIRSIIQAENITEAAQELKDKINAYKKG